MRALVLLIAATLIPATASAQQAGTFEWKQDDTAAPKDPARASKNGFGVMMLVTSDYEGFWKAWEGPTPPKLTTSNVVTRAKPIVHGMLILSGCKPGPDGRCNLTGELSIIGPDGKAYEETMQAPIWEGTPAPEYNLQLSPVSLGFRLEEKDALGRYTLRASVTDRVAGTSLTVEQAVTATK